MLPSGQSTHPLSSRTRFAGRSRSPEIQIERVQFRHARLRAPKLIGIMLVFGDEVRQDVAAAVVVRCLGIDPLLDAEQAELGVGRSFELFVGEDFGARGMIDGVQLDLIQIGHLAQFFGDADFVAAVLLAESAAPGICTYSS